MSPTKCLSFHFNKSFVFSLSFSLSFFSFLFFNFNSASADTATFYPVMDGYVRRNVTAETWAQTHDATDGDYADNTTASINLAQSQEGAGTGKYNLARGFLTFDTSSIPANAVIDSATLSLTVFYKINTDNDGDDWINVFQTSQTNHTSLLNADYSKIGSAEGASRIDITNIATGDGNRTTLDFNSTGLGWIKKSGEVSNCSATTGITCLGVREGHDALNIPIANDTDNSILIRYSEYPGTGNDPVLTVNYTIPVSSSSSSFPSSSSSSSPSSSSSSSQSFSSSSSSLTSTDLTPPSVSITSPTSASTYSTTISTVSLSGTASDNVGVSTITCTNNGASCGTVTGTTNWSVSNIPLIVGTNNIVLTARDAANNVSTKTLTITRTTITTTGSNVWQPVPIRTKAQQTAGLAGGEGTQLITSMVIAPSNPNTMFISVDQSRILKSTDGGTTWVPKHKGITSSGVLTVAVHPTNENIVFAAGGNIGFVPTADTIKGIYRSLDGGENWEMVKSGIIYTFPGNIRAGSMIAFGSGTTVYAGSQGNGLWKSTDNGTTWSQFAPTVGNYTAHLAVDPNNASILYVSSLSNNTVYKIVDTGTSPTITTFYGIPAYANVLVIDKNNSNIMYATLRDKGVYKSINGGTSWSAINNGLVIDPSIRIVTGLAISPANSNYLYVSLTGNEFYYSHDAGATWVRPVSMDELNADGWVSGSTLGFAETRGAWQSGPVTAHPTNPNVAFMVGEMYHIKKTTDAGLTWKYSSNGYKGGAAGATPTLSDSTPITWTPDPNRFLVNLFDWGVFLTTDGGSTFRFLNNPKISVRGGTTPARSVSAGAIDPDDPETIVITNGEWDIQQIMVTHNASAANPSWMGIPNTGMVHFFVAFHPQKKNIVYAGRWKSVDNGTTWTDLGNKILTMHPINGDIIYRLEYSGANVRIAKSINAGSAWTYPFPDLISSNHFTNSSDIGEFAADPTNDNVLWVAIAKQGVYKITTSGITLKSNGITPDCWGMRYTRNIAIDPNNSNVIYASGICNHIGSAAGVFRSTDGGENWTNITTNTNLGSHFTGWSISVNPHNSYVYVGSYEGTWRLPPPGTGTIPSDTTPPVVSITSPTSASTYSTTLSTVSLSGSASDSSGISSVSCTVNGASCGTVSGTTNWSINNIPLIVGTNNIVITARDSSNNGNTATLSVTRTTTVTSSSSSSVSKFMINDRVVSTDNVNVRASASLTGALLGTHPLGSLGNILSSPISSDGYNWYNVNFDSAPDGWSADLYLEKTVVQSSSSSSSAPLPTLATSANKTLSVITPDGNLNESVWSISEPINRTVSVGNNNTATFSVLWNNQYLFVGVKVLDSVLKNDSANPWEDDSVEIYVDGAHNHSASYDSNDRQIIKGQGDQTAVSFQLSTPNLVHGTVPVPGGYSMEFAIPWSDIGITPSSNLTIGFDLNQNDDDTGGNVQSTKGWNSTAATNYLSTVNFGHLTLSATTVGTLPSSSSSSSAGVSSNSSSAQSSSSSSSIFQTFQSSSSSSSQGTATVGGGGGGSSGGGTIGTVAPLAPYVPQSAIQTPFTPPLLQQSHSTAIPPKKVTGPFSIGMRSSEVKVLQEMLASDPSIYPEGEVSGYYGPSTTKAVKRFQKKHGIEETGLAGFQTRAKLNEVYGQTQSSYQYQTQTHTSSSYVFTRELSLNSKGSDVTELQKRLTSEGTYSGPITGYYGRLTREAVRKYQARNNLPQAGAVGPRTLNLLNGSSSSSSSTSSPGLSLAQLVELLINLGIISSDKADLARNALKAMGR